MASICVAFLSFCCDSLPLSLSFTAAPFSRSVFLSLHPWRVCVFSCAVALRGPGPKSAGLGATDTDCCCCCCCCCKRRRSSSFDSDDEQFARRREEIRQRADERRAERKVKHDEIRKKYGLIPDSDHPYSKFENE
uniref:Uncharacterized protein n=1 Tax=Cyprinus carpio TaxID=7962 RepID=A0A8C1TD25_CYPCA